MGLIKFSFFKGVVDGLFVINYKVLSIFDIFRYTKDSLDFIGFIMKDNWFVYILRCADWTFYTGITNNLERRIYEHNFSKKWAKYTKARRPVELIFSSSQESKSLALKEEFRIKSLNKLEKIKLVENNLT